MSYSTRVKIRFAHVDSAQIVFFPRYAEILQGAIEDYMAEHVGCDIVRLQADYGVGMPAVHLDIDYIRPSRLWDDVEIRLDAEKIGRSSLTLKALFHVDEEPRVKMTIVVVCTDMEGMRSVPWPKPVRLRLPT